uniref:Rpn family recombination-promoting nuclease/putative transposase n=1 Tax=Acetatifactor sp. TaxID=1872090 RepID=UPI004057A2C9
MTDTKRSTGILNTKLADSSSKIIFEDNILCSQFLRDYIDLPYMKEIQPEDIEDVSDQYVPLFAEERNADRVKRVNMKNEKPFFLISLIEHKTKVDYNVCMQIFRYMVYIWEAYAREAEKLQKGVTRLADFKYPPILPIVYYEGVENWTIPVNFRSRVMEGDTFGRYIPDFEYYLVPLRKYSNEELLAKKDEISLVMMINRMQNERDIEEFQNLPAEEVEYILKDTPDHLLNIISEILRAFLMKMNVSVVKTDELVGKVREKKMGILFENVEPFDIEKERQKRIEAERQAAKAVAAAKEAAQEAAQEAAKAAAKAAAQAAAKQQLEKSIQILIDTCKELGESEEGTARRLQEKFELDETEVWEKLKLCWRQ